MVDLLPVRDEQACVAQPCPRCGSRLVSATGVWWRCRSGVCPYEMPGEAYKLYCELSEMVDRDPEAFFKIVSAYRSEVRALEPAWMR
ncbi:hypothetical protein AOB60_37740 [Streptomyces noursei]|uniref:Uncharacterized protein n=1 Tax=Streptomyces noursei TaxID=1971 RepID=A0A2N8P4J3_STRNR|nr:hypothetical protein AOB60_37740 [Streptomyces noursei]